MSATVMYAGPESGPFAEIARFQNSWGGAMYIWRALGKKYCGDEIYVMTHGEQFWPLWKDEQLTEWERIALLATFDKFLVRVREAARLAGVFRAFVRGYPPGSAACSLPAQAEVLDRLAAGTLPLAFTPFAVGWQQTTVAASHWTDRRTGEEDAYRPYNLASDTDHQFLFDVLAEEVLTVTPETEGV